MPQKILGIDIGGSSIKAAIVDTDQKTVCGDSLQVKTPVGAHPDAISQSLKDIQNKFSWVNQEIGCTFPGVVQNGVIRTAANVDKAWLGIDAAAFFSDLTSCPVSVINDADAAGIAEIHWGDVRELLTPETTCLLLTFGTGIGSALFRGKNLHPNTELGHLMVNGREAESFASARARTQENLTWPNWIARVNTVLSEIERLLWPEIFILGGAVSKEFENFKPYLKTRVPVYPAHFQNNAGIIGAALSALAKAKF